MVKDQSFSETMAMVSVIDLGYRNGKRYRKSVYGTTRKEVSDELTRELRSQQLGLPVGPGRLTVEGWLKRWLEQQQPPCTKRRPTRLTKTMYEYIWCRRWASGPC